MRRDLLLVAEMIVAAEQAIALAGEVELVELEADRRRRDALLWNSTVLGEAAGAVSEELRAEHPDVPWRSPTRLRNRIVHGYWSVDLELLQTTARDDLPALVGRLRAVEADLRR
jgi:uncharacterized protein with HEPN domain